MSNKRCELPGKNSQNFSRGCFWIQEYPKSDQEWECHPCLEEADESIHILCRFFHCNILDRPFVWYCFIHDVKWRRSGSGRCSVFPMWVCSTPRPRVSSSCCWSQLSLPGLLPMRFTWFCQAPINIRSTYGSLSWQPDRSYRGFGHHEFPDWKSHKNKTGGGTQGWIVLWSPNDRFEDFDVLDYFRIY